MNEGTPNAIKLDLVLSSTWCMQFPGVLVKSDILFYVESVIRQWVRCQIFRDDDNTSIPELQVVRPCVFRDENSELNGTSLHLDNEGHLTANEVSIDQFPLNDFIYFWS